MARAVFHFDRKLIASCATSRAHYPEGTVVNGYEVALEGIFISGRRAVGSTRHLATIAHDDTPAAGDNPETSNGRMPFGHASLWITRKVLRNLQKTTGPATVRIEIGDQSVDWLFGDKKITVTHVLKYESGHPDYPDYRSLVNRVAEDHGDAKPVTTLAFASDVLRILLDVAHAMIPAPAGASLRICQSSTNYHVVRYCSQDGCAKHNIFSIVGTLSEADILPNFALMDLDRAKQPIWDKEDVDHLDDEDYTDDTMEEDGNDDESEYDPDEEDEVIDPDQIE